MFGGHAPPRKADALKNIKCKKIKRNIYFLCSQQESDFTSLNLVGSMESTRLASLLLEQILLKDILNDIL